MMTIFVIWLVSFILFLGFVIPELEPKEEEDRD